MEQENISNLDERVIRKGDSFFRTKNTDLAVLLLTVGVKPFKSNPIVRSVDANGKEDLFFNLETHNNDRTINCQQVLSDWKRGTAYIEENPNEPIAVAMATIFNRKHFMEVIKTKKRTFEYKLDDGPTVFVTEGTKKQKILEKKYGKNKK
jgi:hypothetical protein